MRKKSRYFATVLVLLSFGMARPGACQALLAAMRMPPATPATPSIELAQPAQGHDAPVAPAPAPLAVAAAPALPVLIRFARASAQLTPRATRALDRVGRALGAGTLRILHVQGHTDGAGRVAARCDLAWRRAEAIALYLRQNFPITHDRVQVAALDQPGRTVVLP